MIEKNPCTYATVPKHKSQKREIWTAETLMYAMDVCEDERLKLAINLSLVFSKSEQFCWFYAAKEKPATHLSLPDFSGFPLLVEWKAEQDEVKEVLGEEYIDYNLVMATTFGNPIGTGAIRGQFNKLIEEYNLPPVVFHFRICQYFCNKLCIYIFWYIYCLSCCFISHRWIQIFLFIEGFLK